MNFNNKKQEELIVPPAANFTFCPFCSQKCTIEYKKPFWVLAPGACRHADMAVAAGGFDISIRFVE